MLCSNHYYISSIYIYVPVFVIIVIAAVIGGAAVASLVTFSSLSKYFHDI